MSFRKRRWKLILTIFTILALAALLFAVRRQVFETIDNLKRVNAWALLLLPVLQVLNFHSQAKLYQSLFRMLGERFRYRSMYRLALELGFVNNIFPSAGVSGFSYIGVRMKPEGISAGKTTLVQMMKFASVFISFQVMLFIGLIMLAIGGQASRLTILIASSLATLVLIMTLAIIFIVGSRKRIYGFITFVTMVINRLIHIFRTKHPETISMTKVAKILEDLHQNYEILKANYKDLKMPLLYALMANLAEVATIYVVYIAFGHLVNPGAVIIAYAVANFAGIMSVLPGGVGIYEALMTAVLASAGVPAGVSLPVTVMYRVINILIQLPPGYYFYYKTLHAKPLDERQA